MIRIDKLFGLYLTKNLELPPVQIRVPLDEWSDLLRGLMNRMGISKFKFNAMTEAIACAGGFNPPGLKPISKP